MRVAGAPELRLGLSEDLVVGRGGGNVYGATVVDDITFHQGRRRVFLSLNRYFFVLHKLTSTWSFNYIACNLGDFERDRVIALQAPEGECVVLNYRISGDFDLPFRVFPFIEEIDEGRIDVILVRK